MLKDLNKLTVNGLVAKLWVNISNIDHSNPLGVAYCNLSKNKIKSLKFLYIYFLAQTVINLLKAPLSFAKV